jgi:hypothetical protein
MRYALHGLRTVSCLMFKSRFYTPGLIYQRPEGEIGAHYTVENLPFVVTSASMIVVQSTSSFF